MKEMLSGRRLTAKLTRLAVAAVAMSWCSAAWAAGGLAERPAVLTLDVEPQMLAAAPAANEDDWHIVARLGLWGMSVDGDASVREYGTDFSMDVGDILDNLNFAFMPGIELGKDRWALVFNGVFAQLENDEQFSRTLPGGRVIEGGADITMDMYIADLAVGYRLWDIPLGEGKSDMMLSITPAVGVRYTYLKIDVNPDRFESRDQSADIWDPYVGGRMNLQFNKELAWRTDGSIGGFGVGSDLAWTLQSFIDWRFARNLELNLGYRVMDYDYEDGDFELDLTMHGPWIGISVYWN